MKSVHLFCLLSAVLLATGTLRAALSPAPVVEIIKVNLPLVEVRITNPSETEPCIVWKPGMSWEEQTKWFSLRTAAGGKVWELRPAPQDYTRNFPNPESIPPKKSVVRYYNLADKWWTVPKDFAPKNWNYQIQAHLDIPQDQHAHLDGVFIGHAMSAWCDPAGREVEKAPAPQVPEKYAATETPNDFPVDRLHARLDQIDFGFLPKGQSLADFIGKDFPWGPLEGRIEYRAVTILLPNRQVLSFVYHDELKDPFKHRGAWLPAKDLLAKLPGRGLLHVSVRDGAGSRKGEKGYGKVFSRYFDEDGYKVQSRR